MSIYLVLCEDLYGIRWYEIVTDPTLLVDRAAHFGPIETEDDYHSTMDAVVTLASKNDFALDDEDTWPLE